MTVPPKVIEKPTEFFNDPQLPDKNKMANGQANSLPENQHPPKILSDDALYEMAWKETESNNGDRGLWAKAYSVCDGDKKKTRAYYIRERVTFLQRAQHKRLDEYKKRKEEEEESKRKNIEEKIHTLRKLWKRREVLICRKEARVILENMGINYGNISQLNEKDLTPLMSATIEGDKNKIELLLLAGANPLEKSTFGKTASHIARRLKQDDIALLIDGYSRGYCQVKHNSGRLSP